jgi:2-keto-3-deoxy-L-rhamnonate aldolase RhmA
MTLRDEILSGPVKLGVAVSGGSPALIEIAGSAGCKFVWIEIEHAGTDMMHAEHLCRAADLHGMWPLLRVPDGGRSSVLRALEVGGRIIVTPQIHTPDLARKVVEYGKFPPLGMRGFNTGSRGMRYGAGGTVLQAMEEANRRTALLVQIESVEGVKNADAILGTEGIDGVLVGPGDLSMSMGITGQWDNADLIRTIEGIFAVAHRHQKVVATVCSNLALSKRWKAAGAHLLNIASDIGLFRAGITDALQKVKAM